MKTIYANMSYDQYNKMLEVRQREIEDLMDEAKRQEVK